MQLLSVLIPLYNKEHSVGRAIESVLSQQYPHFELIIVDDGSTDHSYQQCLRYDDPRIRVVRQANQGVSAARNHAAQLARADYLCFLDADDAYAPEFLTRISQLIQQEPAASLYSCAFDIIDETGCLLPLQSAQASRQDGKLDNFFNAFQANRQLICASSFAIRRDLFEQLGGFPVGVTIGEDMYLWCQAGLRGPLMYCPKVSVSIYQNAENRTIHRQQQSLAWHLVYFLRDRQWQQQLPVAQCQALERFIIHNCWLAALGALRFGRCSLARDYADLLKHRHPAHAWLLKMLSTLPQGLFLLLRRWRNRSFRRG